MPLQPFTVATPDGLTLAGSLCGNPAGPEILFIHGFSQSQLSWARQLADPELQREFRMAAFDLRGHGASDKPQTLDAYTDDRRWADDVAAVIAAAGMKRPALVGWSYAGRTLTDYVRHRGQEGISGLHFVAANTRDNPAAAGPALAHSHDMMSDDLATNIAGTRAFLRGCFEVQPSPEDFETMLAFNAMVSPAVRRALRSRTHNPGDLVASFRIPVLVTHGDKDRVSLLTRSQFTADTAPGAKLSIYPGVGHAPFWEDAPRFNRELAAFVRAANREGRSR
jgi:pimeloyl-ACP methyl ester carboxylesterase